MDNKILVTRSSMPSIEEYVDEIKELWETHFLTNMGTKHKLLENRLKKYLGVEHISLFSNGHMALELLLQALEMEGEVITTPFTFASTTHAIVRNGLKPVFCDISLENYTLDVQKIESLITDKTVAIVPVHVYGNICDVSQIEKIADKYGLKVIYDAAHAFGETWLNQGVGNFGDASMFSFHATKVFHTIEGGGITYKDPYIGEQLYKLKNFGIQSEEVVDGVGANAKMNEFQAAMGICNLRHIDEEIEKRKKIAELYTTRLQNYKGIVLTKKQPGLKSNYAYFPIRVVESEGSWQRDKLCEVLKQENIFTRKYFYPLTSSFECYKGKFEKYQTPIAEMVASQILTLPIYADLELSVVERICDIIEQGC